MKETIPFKTAYSNTQFIFILSLLSRKRYTKLKEDYAHRDTSQTLRVLPRLKSRGLSVVCETQKILCN